MNEMFDLNKPWKVLVCCINAGTLLVFIVITFAKHEKPFVTLR